MTQVTGYILTTEKDMEELEYGWSHESQSSENIHVGSVDVWM